MSLSSKVSNTPVMQEFFYGLKLVITEQMLTVLLALSTRYCTSEQKRSSFASDVPHGTHVVVSVSTPDLHPISNFPHVTLGSLSCSSTFLIVLKNLPAGEYFTGRHHDVVGAKCQVVPNGLHPVVQFDPIKW